MMFENYKLTPFCIEKKEYLNILAAFSVRFLESSSRIQTNTRGDQKVRGKVLLNIIAFLDCNENS